MRFKDFYIQNHNNDNNSNENLPVSNTINSIISLNCNLIINPNDSKKLADDITKIATSPDFINELDKEIELPQEHESKEQFVERACNVLRNKLNMLFDKVGKQKNI